MNHPNLFLRLEGYARENFTTEALAYILETDFEARRKFLELLLEQRKSMRGAFCHCKVKTQVAYACGRPDLEITSEKCGSKIFVEVKTESQEGDSQIKRYLNLGGHVAYLTPLGFDSPSIPDSIPGRIDRFLGHFFWHDVYKVIKSANPNSEINQQFLTYLEVHHMGPPEPFTQQDLKVAAQAVAFITKTLALVQGVRKKIQPEWEGTFGTNTGATRVSIGEGLPYWWYRPKEWKKKGGKFYLQTGLGFEPGREQSPAFFVTIGSSQKSLGRRLDDSLGEAFAKLRQLGWKKEPDTAPDWGYTNYFQLREGDINSIVRQQAKNVLLATEGLRQLRLIDLIKNKL